MNKVCLEVFQGYGRTVLIELVSDSNANSASPMAH